jgi:hypothetical protein
MFADGSLFARVDQRLLALAAVIWRTTDIGAPGPRSLIAYGHWSTKI